MRRAERSARPVIALSELYLTPAVFTGIGRLESVAVHSAPAQAPAESNASWGPMFRGTWVPSSHNVQRRVPTAHGALRRLPSAGGHSHSMVPGGLEVMSRVTRLISLTSLVMRVEMRLSTS